MEAQLVARHPYDLPHPHGPYPFWQALAGLLGGLALGAVIVAPLALIAWLRSGHG